MEAGFFENFKIRIFQFQKNLKKIIQVNKDAMCKYVKFEDEIP